MTIYMGLMSGTSMDGIDAAVIEVETQRLIGGLTRPYDQDVRDQLMTVASGIAVTPAKLWQLHTVLGRQFAAAANDLLQLTNLKAHEVTAIGSHGQTICHDATAAIPYTIQLGCPHMISELTGITVVADFRTRDLVIGGQGAPFAPLYHHALFAASYPALAIVNIGGISNVTFVSQDEPTSGYDIGPGNCLMDEWIHQQKNKGYDDNGAYAASGTVIPALLSDMLADDYFKLPYPKSICKSYFSLNWLQAFLKPEYAPQDVQASLLALTAHTIAEAILASDYPIQRVAICGGGAHNNALLYKMRDLLPNVVITSTKELGIDADFLEAMMFAWLAHQTLNKTPLDLSHITGAKKPAILGAIYPASL
ncbi:MAG: anhydro-N-acetylmuramic acid kinase [Legionella sp.]|nr:MAG: anhydro-N-acetylmuramic acid kinase [Legionella sp.]